MEVMQEKYKDTKVGRIPMDWEVMKLSEVVDILNNKRKPLNSSHRNLISGDVPYYGANGQVDSINDFIFNEPLILMAEDGGNFSDYAFRHIAYKISGKSWVNNHAHVLKPKSAFDFDYVFYDLEHKNILRFINGSTRTKLNQGDLKGILLKIPPLPEQQKIAAILSTVDEQISSTDKIIEKSKELKKGLMQKLFSEGIGHTEFKDTKIGRIPKDWEVLKISKVADCYGGTTPSTAVEEYWNGDVLWATPSDITKNKSEFLLDTNRKITEQGRVSKNLRFVQKNGLLMTSRASIGFLNISNGDVVTNQGFINIECKANYHYKFFYYWILDNRKKLLSLSQGSTFLELNRKTFAKINIPFPQLPEQQKIAAILSEADAKIEKEQTQKAQLEALKKGLMQQLLTGKKRVKV